MIFYEETCEQRQAREEALCRPQPWRIVFAWKKLRVDMYKIAWLQFVEEQEYYYKYSGYLIGPTLRHRLIGDTGEGYIT